MPAFILWARGLIPARVWIGLAVAALVAISLARIATLLYNSGDAAGYARRDADYRAVVIAKNDELRSLTEQAAALEAQSEAEQKAAVADALAHAGDGVCKPLLPEQRTRLNRIR